MPLTRALSGILGADTLSTGSIALNTGVPITESPSAINIDYCISTGSNAISVGPISINDGVTLVIPDNSTWTIV
jgi:hypothetical protein